MNDICRHDNPIETDGGMHNIRVMRNLMINSASHAFCNQPALGGPVYWIRNIAYNLPGGSSRLTSGSAGVVELLDFALKPTAIAVDKGVALPNVNTNFAGRAPDLGALEVGRSAPQFGPRR